MKSLEEKINGTLPIGWPNIQNWSDPGHAYVEQDQGMWRNVVVKAHKLIMESSEAEILTSPSKYVRNYYYKYSKGNENE